MVEIEKITNKPLEANLDDSPKVTEEITPESKEKEYAERIARIQAEFENFRKRTEKEKQEIITNANANLISELSPSFTIRCSLLFEAIL